MGVAKPERSFVCMSVSGSVLLLYKLYFLHICVKNSLENEMIHLKGFNLLINCYITILQTI